MTQRSTTVRHLLAACVLVSMAALTGCPDRRGPQPGPEPTPVDPTQVEQQIRSAVREYVLAHADIEDQAARDIDAGKLTGTGDYQARFFAGSSKAKDTFAAAVIDAMNAERPIDGPKAEFHRAAARGYRGAVR